MKQSIEKSLANFVKDEDLVRTPVGSVNNVHAGQLTGVTTVQTTRSALWGKDPDSLEVKKWLMAPFPINEINKGYGLIQNSGW